MSRWLDEVEPLTLKGRIALPYTWWVGDIGSCFLKALRDEQKILANRCPQCGTVFVPPRKNCGSCFKEAAEWREVGPEGTISAHTIVRYPSPVQPLEPPFALALIRLDGAGVDFLHLVSGDLDRLENGARVKPRFARDRRGGILDIESFELA